MPETETVDQPVVTPESVIDGGGKAEGIEDSGASTEGQEGNNPETKDLPPELQEKQKELMRSYHEKTQALAEEKKSLAGELDKYKQDANALYNLSTQEWFKKAVEAEKGRRSGRQVELSDESFEAIKSDKRAFQEFLAGHDKALADGLKSEFKAEFEKLGKSQYELTKSRELDNVTETYGDEFTKANESGALSSYLDKNYDHETAFKLYMQDQGKVAQKASATVSPATKKAGAIEKGGMALARGGPVVKAKSLNDALDRAFDLAKRGVKDYRFSKE